MTSPTNIPITSLNALISSIHLDGLVYKWFEFLITQRTMTSELSHIEEMSNYYNVIKKTTQNQILIAILIFLVFLIALLTHDLRFTLFLILLTGLFWHYQKQKIHSVALISKHIILRDFSPEKLSLITLYQICEIYSRRYRINSLVDTIYYTDKWGRAILLITILVIWFAIPILFAYQVILAFLTYHLVLFFLKSIFIYKNLSIESNISNTPKSKYP